MTKKIIIHILLLGLIIVNIKAKGQDSYLAELKSLYTNQNYEQVFGRIESTGEKSTETTLFQALAFHNLPDKHPIKKEVKNEVLYPLTIIQKIPSQVSEEPLQFKEFFSSELQLLQKDIFNSAKASYERGRKKEASLWFDELHTTFNNSRNILKNHYAFNDHYFLQTLKEEIEVPDEFKENFFNRYNLLEKYYHSNEKFREWNNPKYRLANTAKDESYLKESEKKVFYFLNLARMNPELFRETFIHAKLHIQYHGDLELNVPVYDSLKINKYKGKLSFREFFELPVHRIFKGNLPSSVIDDFIQKTVIKKTKRGKRFRYDINYKGFYKYLETKHPDMLNLKNLKGYQKTKNGDEYLLYKLYDKKYSIYRKSYTQETENSFYYQSLFDKLTSMEPKSIIYPSKDLFRTAECWAVEAGKLGLKGHDRVKCRKDYDAESCDYGNNNGFDVVLSLLVDKFVPDLGHRKTLLGDYSKMGVAIRPHKSGFEYNAVLDFYR